jgi:hypothetical protein
MRLWKPLDHEKSANKDKLLKPPYKENFASPASQKLSSGLSEFGLRVVGHTIVRTPKNFQLQIRGVKDRMKRELRRVTNHFPIVIFGRLFAFKWTKDTFAKKNGLTAETADACFENVKAEAIVRLAMVETRIARLGIAQTETGRVFTFNIKELTNVLPFANDFRIEDEFSISKAETPSA